MIIALVINFSGKQLQRTTIHSRFCIHVPLQSVISLARVRWPGVEYYLAIHGPGHGVPIGRSSQVGYFLEIVHALEMRKHLACMAQEVRQEVGRVAGALEYVADYHMEVYWQVLGVQAVATKADICLMLYVF